MASGRVPLRVRVAVAVAAFIPYLVACALPAVETSTGWGNRGTFPGIALLVLGWSDPAGLVAWLSNVLLLAGFVLLLLARTGPAAASAAAGLLLAGAGLLSYPGGENVLLGAKWWWLGSHVILAAGCLSIYVRAKRRPA